jgi:hypothetical protein
MLVRLSCISLFLLIFFACSKSTRADAVGELASFSVFSGVNLSELKGDAKSLRGPAMGNSRFQSVQTCWVAPGSPAQVAAAIRSFNPSRHSDLHVMLHSNGANFSQLSHLPNDGSVQWLMDATEKKSTDLQISREEAAKSGPFAQFWSGILTVRSSAGVFGQPSYDHTGKNIRAGEEINSMLGQQGKIRQRFSGLIGSKGEQYWELLDVDKKAVLTLGASFNRGQQSADVLYYASGGYYAAITLYQFWPVEVEGKASTLVWRGDMISSAELADLRGVERLGSESALLRDVAKSVRALRSDSGGH